VRHTFHFRDGCRDMVSNAMKLGVKGGARRRSLRRVIVRPAPPLRCSRTIYLRATNADHRPSWVVQLAPEPFADLLHFLDSNKRIRGIRLDTEPFVKVVGVLNLFQHRNSQFISAKYYA
jgi:hypothetical protein